MKKKTPVKKTPVKKTPVKKTPVKKTPVKKTPVKKTPVKKTAPRDPPKLEEWAWLCPQQQLSQAPRVSDLFRKFVEEFPDNVPSSQEMRALLDEARQVGAAKLRELAAKRDESLERALVRKRKAAVKILVEHGAASPKEVAERLYADSAKWKLEENTKEAKRLLEDLRRRGLVKRCGRTRRYYISEEGKRFHLESFW